MSRYIDADALIEAHYQYCNEHHTEADCFYHWSHMLMLNAPSIDIVRCKECKHWHKSGEITCCERIDYGYGYKADDYCSYGERKDDDKYVP